MQSQCIQVKIKTDNVRWYVKLIKLVDVLSKHVLNRVYAETKTPKNVGKKQLLNFLWNQVGGVSFSHNL